MISYILTNNINSYLHSGDITNKDYAEKFRTYVVKEGVNLGTINQLVDSFVIVDFVPTSENFANAEFVATLKCDGSSVTFIFKNGEFRVCGRNKEFTEAPGNSFWKIAKKYKIENMLRAAPVEMAIQGEACGPGIQKNPLKLDELTFLVYQIRDVTNHVWFDWDQTKQICNTHGIPHVPEVARFTMRKSVPSNEDLQDMANDAKYDNGRANAEGIVIRPVSPIRSAALQKDWWSLKVMNQPYDAKKG
jgi:hypothetical protein